MKLIFLSDKHKSFLQVDTITSGKKEVSEKVDFLHAVKHESSQKIDSLIFDGDDHAFPKFPKEQFAMNAQYLRKEVRDEVDFLHADKYQSFLQVDFNTLGINISYKVIVS